MSEHLLIIPKDSQAQRFMERTRLRTDRISSEIAGLDFDVEEFAFLHEHTFLDSIVWYVASYALLHKAIQYDLLTMPQIASIHFAHSPLSKRFTPEEWVVLHEAIETWQDERDKEDFSDNDEDGTMNDSEWW
jgi:hypothetical protein